MTSGSNTSILDDFAYALRSVVRTILGVCLLAILLIVGLFLIGFAILVGGFLWLGHKIGLIKDPPSVKFRRFQGRMASRLIQAKLGKMGFGNPAGGGPFGQAGPFGNAGGPGQAGPFAGAEAEAPAEPKGKTTVQEVDAEDVVNAEELEEFHGSLEEFMRHKRGR
jgi:hypothetical protein